MDMNNINECNQELTLLRKALEWELSLDSRDLRSQAWYHGSISRQQSEKIVEKEGDFLIRDCASQPGNYVLTCRSNSIVLHFVINKVILQPETVYERIQYQFEDDAYDTLPDLITFYVGSGKVISAASNARIQFPCNRKVALCLYGHKYVDNANNITQSCSINSLRSRSISNADLNAEPYCQEQENYNVMTSHSVLQKPVLASFSKKYRSQSLTATQIVNQKKYSSADGIVKSDKVTAAEYQISLQNNMNDNVGQTENSKLCTTPQKFRHFGAQQMSELVRDVTIDSLNPYHASGSDSGNGSGDSVQSSAIGDTMDITHRGVVIKNPQYMIRSASSILLKYNYDFDVISAERKLFSTDIPVIQQTSKFDLENFHTLLLPVIENKPLDNDALCSLHMMLTDSGPRVIAQHMSRIDYNLILGTIDKQASDSCSEEMTLECSGIELITLPHGEIFRNDLIERTECLKLLVAVTILTCKTELDRAIILNKWIQIAVETKTALGNLFGFSAIMMGLSMPQVQKLETTWHTLRQKFTESAFTFEAKLKPCFYNMNDCSNPQAPNTTIPHLLPYILLKDRNIDEIVQLTLPNSVENLKKLPLISACITSWEAKAEDFGLSILYSHLDATRNFTKNLPIYKRNANGILQDLNIRFDELLNDAFRTEFHIKFLWGSNSYTISAPERHAKLEHVLTLMATKFCNLNEISSVG